MRVVYHLGAHHTDQDRLVRTLLRNRDALARQGIVVPGPGRYRKVLRDVVNRLRGAPATREAQDLLLEAIVEGDAPGTLVLSNESFICLADRALDEGRLYARAYKTAWLRQVFPEAETVFALAIRDPATFVPALYAGRGARELDFEDYLTGVDPLELRWSETVAMIREHNPGSRIIVWCNEDTILTWASVMQAVSGADPETAFEGALDPAREVVTEEGTALLSAHFGRPPHRNTSEFREALAAIVEFHVRDDGLAEVIDLPDWDADLMAELTAGYDADLARIAAMPGVQVLTP